MDLNSNTRRNAGFDYRWYRGSIEEQISRISNLPEPNHECDAAVGRAILLLRNFSANDTRIRGPERRALRAAWTALQRCPSQQSSTMKSQNKGMLDIAIDLSRIINQAGMMYVGFIMNSVNRWLVGESEKSSKVGDRTEPTADSQNNN